MTYQSSSAGHIIIAVLHGISNERIRDNKFLSRTLKELLESDNFTINGSMSHTYDPQGFTTAHLLAESHAAVHTYPEFRSLFFDLYSCRGPNDGNSVYSSFVNIIKPTNARIVFQGQVTVDPNFQDQQT